MQYHPGYRNTVAYALFRQPFAGEPDSVLEDAEYDGCVAVCGWLHHGTDLDVALVAAGMNGCKVRQIRAAVVSSTNDGNDGNPQGQGNTCRFPGYSTDELIVLQQKDSVISGFRRFWDQKRRPHGNELKVLPKPVRTLLKHWNCMRERQGLLYHVFEDVWPNFVSFMGSKRAALLHTTLLAMLSVNGSIGLYMTC